MTVSQRLRFEVMRRDGFRCRYCNAEDRPLEVDHVVARSLGGGDHPSNLVTACNKCNPGKGSSRLDSPYVDDLDRKATAHLLQNGVDVRAVGFERPDMRRAREHGAQEGIAWWKNALLGDLAGLFESDVDFWTYMDGTPDEIHRPGAFCVDLTRILHCVLDYSIYPLDRDDAIERVEEYPEWSEPPGRPEDGLWVIPSRFCEICCTNEAAKHNQQLSDDVLNGVRP